MLVIIIRIGISRMIVYSNRIVNSNLGRENRNIDHDRSAGSADNITIVRHRKVYVSPRMPDVYHIKLTVPVEMPKTSDLPVSEPKPMYEMRKYTTYKTRPETLMVPVKTTIIKPAGLTDDQIIKD